MIYHRSYNHLISCIILLYPTKIEEFIFPVYYFGIPSIVEEFIRRIKFEGTLSKGSYLVLTCGGTTGNALGIFKNLLEERELKLDYIFAVDMPDNYILIYDIQKPRQQKIQLDSLPLLSNGQKDQEL
jgi:hypothetical protein